MEPNMWGARFYPLLITSLEMKGVGGDEAAAYGG